MNHFVWISEQTQIGQSAAAFCRERVAWLFYAWKKRLREAEGSNTFTMNQN